MASKSHFAKNFLESTTKQFEYYKMLGEKAMAQLNDEQLFDVPYEDGNSIAIIVNHLRGNMLSRWTDFLTSDGEKAWRERDAEFENAFKTRSDIDRAWNEGWIILFEALNSVNNDNFDTRVYIRNQGHSILEAVNRQLAHYAYHIGQMVLLARMFKGAEWQSLSIPKGESKTFNAQKFSQEKEDRHFTDEFLNEE